MPLLLVAIALLVGLLAMAPPGPPSPAVVSLALAAVLLELAPATTGLLAGSAYVALAALNPPAAALTACGAMLVRTLLRGKPRAQLPGLVAVLATALALVVLSHWLVSPVWLALAGLEVYLPLALLLSGARHRVAPLEAGAAFLAPVLVQLGWAGPLWLAPVYLVLLRGFRETQGAADPRALEQARAERSRLEDALAQALADQKRTGDQLARRSEELGLLRQLARSLAERPDTDQMVELVLANLKRLVGCRSAAFFQPEAEGLFPTRHQSPEASRLEGARLLKLREPLVEQAWAEQRAVAGEVGPLFEGERSGLALPLEGLGVFYVGQPEPLERDQHQAAALIVAQAELALVSAERFQTQEQALESHSRARQRLERAVGGLGQLLDASRGLAGTLQREALLGRVRAEIGRLVEHERFRLELDGRAEGESHPAWQETAALVAENGKPLLLESTAGTRFAALEVESLLAVPLHDSGVLLLGHRQPGRFQRNHQELLLVLGVQVAAALANVRLHEQVVEAQAQLIQSSKIAAVGQLAAGVAHELNTPLGAVALALDMSLRDPALGASSQTRLKKARNAADRAQQIVSKLLFYTREGRAEERPVEVEQLVEDTLEFLSYHLEHAKITVERQRGPGGRVLGSQHDLQQVLINLLLNARDAVADQPPAERWVGVATRAEGEQVVLEVADRGTGMAPEVAERIFEPFFTTKPVGVGTGLGLSVSQQIVRQHQGSLEVITRPGQGSRFLVRLPRFSESPPA